MSAGSATALIAGGIAASGAVAGAAINSSAAGDATNSQLQAQRESIAFQKEQAAKAEAALQPFRDSQLNAMQQLQGLADPNSQLFQAQRNLSTQAIQRQLSAQGLLRSRNQSDLLSNLEVGLAQNRANILGGLANTGAGQSLAGVYQNTGNSVGSSLAQIGQTIGAGQMAGANALNSGIQGVNNAFQGAIGGYQSYQQNQSLLKLLGQNSAGIRGNLAGGSYSPGIYG